MRQMIEAKWTDWNGKGLERLLLSDGDDGFIAESEIETSLEGSIFHAHYRICCDKQWCTRTLEINANSNHLVLASDGAGTWTDGEGKAIPSLNEAVDIDISASPFTNTLPIRRLRLRKSESADIVVAYIDCPGLGIRIDHQRYTCLEPKKRYRFESTDSDFVRDIEVDKHGLIRMYPDLFRRVDDPLASRLSDHQH